MKKNINSGLVVAILLVAIVLVGGTIAYLLRDPSGPNNLGMLKPGAPPMRLQHGGGGAGGGTDSTPSNASVQ